MFSNIMQCKTKLLNTATKQVPNLNKTNKLNKAISPLKQDTECISKIMQIESHESAVLVLERWRQEEREREVKKMTAILKQTGVHVACRCPLPSDTGWI